MTPSPVPPSVLVVAGSDPLGYSGLQADLFHLGNLGQPAHGVPTCLTEQSRQRFLRVLPIRADHISRAISLSLATGSVGAVKLGLLPSVEVVLAVARALAGVELPVVLDPVLAASSGHSLVEEGVKEALLSKLMPLASVVTPNIPELTALTGVELKGKGLSGREQGARRLLERGADWVVVTGGHGSPQESLVDLLVGPLGTRTFPGRRHPGPVPRGTGCAFSTLLAGELSCGNPLQSAVGRVRSLLGEAIRAASRRGSRRLVF